LSTAIAFDRVLHSGAQTDPDTTHELMHAAIRDGVRAAPRANIRAAAPFSVPKDWRAALGFLVISALAAGIAIPHTDRTPRIVGVDKEKGRPGTEVTIQGENLVPAVRR
jgi:hypothetical protein